MGLSKAEQALAQTEQQAEQERQAAQAMISQLTPVCQITGGSKTAATLQARLISCSVTDVSGIKSDSINIQIDANGLTDWPETGQIIGCKMGYAEDKKLGDLGRFKLNRISESLYPNIMTLTGTAAPFEKADKTELKQRRSYTWYNITLGEMVRQIAKRHGFSPRVHPELDKLPVLHQDQNDETDLTFLSRIAGYHDAVCKPIDNFLVFSRRGEVKSISGKKIAPITIRHPSTASNALNTPSHPAYVNATISSSDKGQHKGIKASWFDINTAQERTVSEGKAPQQRLEKVYGSEQEANQAINAKQRKMSREGDKLTLNAPGNSALAAEGILQLQGFPVNRMDGQWSIDKVTHQYDGGYRCGVEAGRVV